MSRLPNALKKENLGWNIYKYSVKILLYFIGTFISTCGLAILTTNALGSNAMNTLFAAVAVQTSLSVGTIYTIFNSSFLLVGFILARRYMGIASFLMILSQGGLIDFWMAFFEKHPGWFIGFWPKAAMAALGLLMSCFGGGISAATRLGTPGFESCLYTLADRIKIEYKYLKIISETFYLAAAWMLNGVFGIMTFVDVVSFGPLLSFFIINLDKTLFKWLKIPDERNELYRNSRRWIKKNQELLNAEALAASESPAKSDSFADIDT